MRRRARTVAVLSTLVVALLFFTRLGREARWAAAGGAGGQKTVNKADDLFGAKHYREAAQLYREVAKARGPGQHHAAERLILCHLRLKLYDEAIEAAESYIEWTTGRRQEARAERLAGNLYLGLPHWGTRSGGEFHRAEHRQGVRLHSWTYDKKHAVAHLERARDLYATHDEEKNRRPEWHNERIACIFDLANAVSRFTIYENRPMFWFRWWGERDEFRAETAGEEDFDEGISYHEMRRMRMTGLRMDAGGEPIFPETPEEYAPELGDDEKILYLLREARRLDTTADRRYRALGYYRQAMLARSRFGMDRINRYGQLRGELSEGLQDFNPWELGDSEAIVLAGGKLRKVTLPERFDVLALLRHVYTEHEGAPAAAQALYSGGLYHQSRQQYRAALDLYAMARTNYPRSKWARSANRQRDRITRGEVSLDSSSLQRPGRGAELQFRYRNAKRVWFVARRFDAEGLLRELHDRVARQGSESYEIARLLSNWQRALTYDRRPNRAALGLLTKRLGREVRWSQELNSDGTHRYRRGVSEAPLRKRGTYLVSAFLRKPPAELPPRNLLGAGESRALVVVNDLALVQRLTDQGRLFYVTDALTGTPVEGAKVQVLRHWTVSNRQKGRRSVGHIVNLTSEPDGTVLYKPKTTRGAMHALVTAPGGKAAWSGGGLWRHRRSTTRHGRMAYVTTDRPVYRPGQTVRYKLWLRERREGLYRNLPHREVQIEIQDRKGNTVREVSKVTDDYGGVDGELRLDEEAALGVYTIRLDRWQISGGRFRVEEYRKPEFEVSVEPSAEHVKLGEKLTALIKARYYFGEPVTEGTVLYRVFREEYRHRTRFPAPWDWLYGPHYGYGTGRSRIVPPRGSGGRVRELVKQGRGRLDADGTLRVEIDTAPALRQHPDRDHRYVIEAEVRDPSRRVIEGKGSVKVTRQSFYAMLQSERGYYRPGQQIELKLRCVTPDGRPVQTEGVVTVSRVVFGGPDNARLQQKELKRWKAATGEDGELEISLRHERSDRLEVQFTAPDRWGGTVVGTERVWVAGADFNGRLYRFDDLELLTDRRTYAPGETCHLMVATRRPGSYVLFADEVDGRALLSYRVVHLDDGQTVVDIPVKESHVPNFHVDALTVSGMRTHQRSISIPVPPQDAVCDLKVETDKEEYRPGEEATIEVTARTPEGEPVDAQVVLSAFDKAVLQIQKEYGQPIAKFFHGRLRHYRAWLTENLTQRLPARDGLLFPYRRMDPIPPAWTGTWGVTENPWPELAEHMATTFDGFYGGVMVGQRGEMMEAPMAREAMGKGVAADAAAPPQAAAAEQLAEPTVRRQFADTALWAPSVVTGPDGKAKVSFTVPDNLTTWNIMARALGKDTRAGDGSTEMVSTKNLLVRLQAPRFFVEYDEVVLSAIVHNYLEEEKTARVSIELPEERLELMVDQQAARSVEVPAGGQVRVDWRCHAVSEGEAAITVKALTDEESDAVRRSFPALVHGMMKQDSWTGSMRPHREEATQTVELHVPERRRPELTRLEVRYAPSLVGAMMDALPYCLDYPYGCTEQTVSRFLPAVLTLKTLRNMGIELEEVRKVRGRMDEVRRIEEGEHRRVYADSPIFDTDKLYEIINKSLKRIAEMQHADGGWAWWERGDSSGYLTSYVLYALISARQSDVQVEAEMIERGLTFLESWEVQRMRKKHWHAGPLHAFAAYVLSMEGRRAAGEEAGDCLDRLYEGRDELNLYGKALLTLALENLDDRERARVVLRNIMQYLQTKPETEVSWFRTPRAGWWYWYNSDIETNAWCLRALVRLRPHSAVAPRLVKWLLENRRNGYYWRSTRDTTLCVAAMSEFVAASGEGSPDYTLRLSLDDGEVVKEVKISKENFFTYDNKLIVEGVALAGGEHTLNISKQGPGALYWSADLRYFTKERHIGASGLQLKLERTYYRLEQIPYEVEVEGAERQKLQERRLRYKRVPLREGDRIESGDLVQVELRVEADNDYTYLVFEDMKPAGCEPVELRSGYSRQEGFGSYMELRDEKVALFVDDLGRGEHLLRYRLRAEAPGIFHALPAVVQGMYVPELRGNSEEAVIRIGDR